MFSHAYKSLHAPEFPEGLSWLNSQPQRIKSLRGKAILLEIWTYSCINCLHVLPHVQAWHERYRERGLQVIGVHTPEFAFEKIPQNVAQAAKTLGVTFPIVLDSDYKIWNLYANRFWPRTIIIDQDGVIVYDHIGEGGYEETEMEIQALLHRARQKDLPEILQINKKETSGICYPTTPEVFLGFVRGRFGNAGTMIPNEEVAFTNAAVYEEGLVYLHGHFTITNDSVAHTRALPSATEYLTIVFRGFSAQLVARGMNHKEAKVELELDGKPLPKELFGKDVTEERGKAIVSISTPRLYHLVNSETYQKGSLTLKTASDSLECFSLTFGGCRGA